LEQAFPEIFGYLRDTTTLFFKEPFNTGHNIACRLNFDVFQGKKRMITGLSEFANNLEDVDVLSSSLFS
jgi:hypothetical protein